jgi:ankyrin repeat protein
MKVRSSDVQERIHGIEKLLSLGEKGRQGLIDGFPEGEDAARLLLESWDPREMPAVGARPGDIWFTGEGARKTYDRPRVPLAVAAQNGYIHTCEILIARKVDVNAVDASGLPALHRAAKNGYVRIVNLLLEHGAEINSPDDERHAALYHAVGPNSMEMLKLLLARGADPDGRPVVSSAGTSPNVGSQFWARFPARVQETDTPLHRAALENYVYVAAALVEGGANVNSLNGKEQTPLHVAAKAGTVEVAEFLISKGTAVNRKDMYDNTPLHIAARCGKRAMVELLLKHNPDLRAVNSHGYTPYEVADAHGFMDIADMIRARK